MWSQSSANLALLIYHQKWNRSLSVYDEYPPARPKHEVSPTAPTTVVALRYKTSSYMGPKVSILV
jgi:hypothetical protein